MLVAEEIDTVLPDLPRNAQRALLIAGLTLFREHGYHGTSTRAVAKAAGVSDAALYVHYPSKGALLSELALAGHCAVLSTVQQAIAAAHDDPRSRTLAFVESYTIWHAEHSALARVVNYELGALVEPGKSEVLAVRRMIERVLWSELTPGLGSGEFDVDDLGTTHLALLSLGIDVARWFGTTKANDPQLLGRRYAAIAERMLGCPVVKSDSPKKTSAA